MDPRSRDEHTQIILSALRTTRLTVRLFDEHDRELPGYGATVVLPLLSRVRLEHAKFHDLTHDLAHHMQEQAEMWFLARASQDDQEAISINFQAPHRPGAAGLADDDLARAHGQLWST